MYDSIIVGAGMAGLTAAAYLTKAGKRVLLLEKEAHVGGLVHSFKYDGFLIDSGPRSLVNSGILFPMLNELGIDIPMKRSFVSIGIEKDIINLDDSLNNYKGLLRSQFPQNHEDIEKIFEEIKTIIHYMQVQYGIDNPVFMNLKDPKYLTNDVFPWLLKFISTVPRLRQFKLPVNDYLAYFTNNKNLIDVITQHFFKDTPTSFALSYYSLYNDYYYPEEGIKALPEAMEKYILDNGGEIRKKVEVIELVPKNRLVITKGGESLKYKKLIWAADQKLLYNLAKHPYRHKVNNYVGGDSVFSVYATVDIHPDEIPGTEHMFYTPNKKGIGTINSRIPNLETKKQIKEWIKEYLQNNTFEISVPAKRYSTLAPNNKSAIMISTLFDYELTKTIQEMGWYDEFKRFTSDEIVEVLKNTVYPFMDKLMNKHTSTPLTIQKYTNNSDGAITGWAFTNEIMPAVTSITRGGRSVHTKMDHIFQAGMWTFSPSGVPTAILTGKLAANEVLKKLKFPFFIKK